jgi:DNA-binding NarL/FixJ family response regulator
MSKKEASILLADDHELVRKGFKHIINQEWDMKVVAEASNGREAVDLAENIKPDLIIMDVTMPELNGIEATRRLQKLAPQTSILALSMHKDAVYVREMIKAGAKGYLLKDCAEADLLKAIRSILLGKSYISPEISDTLLDDYRKHVTNPIDLLSSREREILQMITESMTNKDIANQLNLSVYTVEAHRGKIMEKLNLHTIAELVRFAIRSGLID